MIRNLWELMAFMKRERLVTVQVRWLCSCCTEGVPWGVIASLSLPFVWGICEGILCGRDAEMKDEIATVVSGDMCQGRKALIWATVLGEQSGHYEWASPPAPSAPAPPAERWSRCSRERDKAACYSALFLSFFSLPLPSLSVGSCLQKKKVREWIGFPFHRSVLLQGEGICLTIWGNLPRLPLQPFSNPIHKPRSYLMVTGITECWVDYSRLFSCSSWCHVKSLLSICLCSSIGDWTSHGKQPVSTMCFEICSKSDDRFSWHANVTRNIDFENLLW